MRWRGRIAAETPELKLGARACLFTLALCLLAAAPAAAQESGVLRQQTDSGTTDDAPRGNPSQIFGNGLSGTFHSLEVKYQPHTGPGPCGYYAIIHEYEDSSLNTSTQAFYFPVGAAKPCGGFSVRTDTWVASDYSSPIVFAPDKFYGVMLYQLNAKPLGSASDAFPQGCYVREVGGPLVVCNPSVVQDIYFVLRTYPPPASPPAVARINPTTAAQGGKVTINGANFGAAQGAGFVSFGAVSAPVDSWSDTQIAVRAPAGTPQGVSVTVTTPQGTSNAAGFGYVPAPDECPSIIRQQSGIDFCGQGTDVPDSCGSWGGGTQQLHKYAQVFTASESATPGRLSLKISGFSGSPVSAVSFRAYIHDTDNPNAASADNLVASAGPSNVNTLQQGQNVSLSFAASSTPLLKNRKYTWIVEVEAARVGDFGLKGSNDDADDPGGRAYIWYQNQFHIGWDVAGSSGSPKYFYFALCGRAAPPPPSQSALLAPAQSPACNNPPQTPTVFYTNAVAYHYGGGSIILSSNPDGTGLLSTDDEVRIEVTRPDGSTVSFSHVYGYPDNPGGAGSLAPLDLSGLFRFGANVVSIRLVDNDRCAGSTAYYLSTAGVACPGAGAGANGWWPWEGNASDTAGGNHASLLGGAPSFAAGKVGRALRFNGSDDAAKVSGSPNINVGAAAGLTIDAWINPADDNPRPLAEWHDGAAAGVQFGSDPAAGTLHANLVDTTGAAHPFGAGGGLVRSDAWQHVAVTYDRSSGLARLYVNGTVVAEQNLGVFTPQTSPGYDLYFGHSRAAGRRYAGLLDEAGLVGRALTPSEIRAIYVAGATGKCAPYSTQALYGHAPHSGFNADPVNTATGNYIFERVDLALPGKGFGFEFRRVYNSADATPGPLGFGWTHSYNVSVTDGGATASVRWGDGHVDVFSQGGGVYTPQNGGVFDQLVRNGDGTFTVTEKNQRRHHFSPAGKLTSITDRNNNTSALSYDAAGNLASVRDTAGRTVSFAYDAQGRITQVADPLPRTVRFAYDANGNLASSTDANGHTTTYTYDAGHRLLTATDPLGKTFVTNVYDAEGRVANQADARGSVTQFTYNKATGQTTITDALGRTSVDWHDVRGRLVRRQDRLGHGYAYTYDGDNNRLSVTDRNGHTTLYSYDATGNVTGQVNPLGKTVALTYDALNNPLTRTDELGQTTIFSYDQLGNLLSSTRPLGVTHTFTYDGFGQLLTATNANGHTTTNAYDAFGNLILITDPLGHTAASAYDAAGRRASATDARGKTSLLAFDAHGNLLSVTDPLGNITRHEYDANNNRTKVTDARGAVTRYAYDANNQLLTTTDALGGVVTNAYDANGNRVSVRGARGHTHAFEYDAEGRLAKAADPLGNVTRYASDAQGNRASVTDAKGKVTTFTYDALNRLLKTTDPLGNATASEYDALGRVTKTTDGNGKSTQFQYDALGRLTQVTDAVGGTARYTYDGVGNRLTAVEPNNNTSTYTYDAANRLLTAANPLNKTYAYVYDAVGNRTRVTDANGASIDYTYDDNNRLAQIRYPDLTTVAYVYDANGNRTSMSDAVGQSAYAYDALNRLTGYTDAYGKTIGYEYDAAGNRTALVYPDGKRVAYAFDAASRVSTVTDWGGRVTSYAYDPNGLLSGTSNANGTTAAYVYDDARRLTNMTNAGPGGAVISSYAFTLDPVGNRTGVSQQEPLAGSPPPGATTYAYDAANRLQSAGPSAFTFDHNGNQKTQTTGAAVTNFNYDFEDRLTSVSDGTTAVQYTYNGSGQRLARTVNGVTTRFVLDPSARLPRLLAETDAAGNLTSFYTNGLGLIAKVTPQGQGYQYHFDARGSVVAVTDSSQNVVNKYAYDPFGSTTSAVEQQGNAFRYMGQFGVTTEPSSLLFASRRFYDPSVGRFLTTDPAEPSFDNTQTLNEYVYSLNNPIVFIDPSGLSGQRDGKVLAAYTGSSDSSAVHNRLISPNLYGGPNATISAATNQEGEWEIFESHGFIYRGRKKKEYDDLSRWEKAKLTWKIIIRDFSSIPLPVPGWDFLPVLEPNDPRYEIDPHFWYWAPYGKPKGVQI